MLWTLLQLFQLVASWIIGILPDATNDWSGVADLIVQAVAFFKSLDLLVDTQVEIGCIVSVLLFMVSEVAFDLAVWVYKRIRGS
jgi:hypothetical protein